MGEIHGEKIVLGEFKNHERDIDYYYPQCLMNEKFQWFNFNGESIKLREIDLNTMEESEIDTSFDFDNTPLNYPLFYIDHYCWSKNRFYGMFKMNNDDRYHLFMFNVDELKWLNVQIVANKPQKLFIDSNDVLTLKIGKYDGLCAFYRIALRKPEKLKNLAHFTVFRQSTLFGNDKYLKCVKRIFITD